MPGITNTEGAETAWSQAQIAIATSNGFAQAYSTSSHSLAASVLAGEGTAMERDYDYTSAVYYADLEDPAEIGRQAGERAVKRLNAKKVKTQQVPVIYDPRVSGGLIGHYAGGINGSSIARGTSFLKDSMGEKIFSDRHQHHRRPAPAARFPVQAVRRRRPGKRQTRHRGKRRADNMGAGSFRRPPA